MLSEYARPRRSVIYTSCYITIALDSVILNRLRGKIRSRAFCVTPTSRTRSKKRERTANSPLYRISDIYSPGESIRQDQTRSNLLDMWRRDRKKGSNGPASSLVIDFVCCHSDPPRRVFVMPNDPKGLVGSLITGGRLSSLNSSWYLYPAESVSGRST